MWILYERIIYQGNWYAACVMVNKSEKEICISCTKTHSCRNNCVIEIYISYHEQCTANFYTNIRNDF